MTDTYLVVDFDDNAPTNTRGIPAVLLRRLGAMLMEERLKEIDLIDEDDERGIRHKYEVQGWIGDDDAPAGGCVYLLMSRRKWYPIYVGMASDGRSRIRAHVNDYTKRQAGFDWFIIYPFADALSRRAVELHLIAELVEKGACALNKADRP